MDVQIRAAGRDDATALSSLLSQLGYAAPAETVAERLEGIGGVLVAEVEGRVSGFAAFQVVPHLELAAPTARITSLVVAEEVRVQGIGRALVEAVAERAGAHGCGRLELTTGDRRAEAHAFYRRLGFADASRRFVRELG